MTRQRHAKEADTGHPLEDWETLREENMGIFQAKTISTMYQEI